MARVPVHQRINEARAAIIQLLTKEGAVISPSELEARLSEPGIEPTSDDIEPHILGLALAALINEGVVVEDTTGSTPSKPVKTITLKERIPGSGTSVARTASNKRALFSRYLGWATGTGKGRPGIFGEAGESAVRKALGPRITEVEDRSKILGVELKKPGGQPAPVDLCGYMIPFDEKGFPAGSPVTVVVEVKNVRHYIYPQHSEVWQLLGKAARISEGAPDYFILPILVCRKAQRPTIYMAKNLGFMVVEMRAQFAGDTDTKEIDEVRKGLHFIDLKPGDEPSKYLKKQLYETAPRIAEKFSKRWHQINSDKQVHDLIIAASEKKLSPDARKVIIDQIEVLVNENHAGSGWTRSKAVQSPQSSIQGPPPTMGTPGPSWPVLVAPRWHPPSSSAPE